MLNFKKKLYRSRDNRYHHWLGKFGSWRNSTKFTHSRHVSLSYELPLNCILIYTLYIPLQDDAITKSAAYQLWLDRCYQFGINTRTNIE